MCSVVPTPGTVRGMAAAAAAVVRSSQAGLEWGGPGYHIRLTGYRPGRAVNPRTWSSWAWVTTTRATERTRYRSRAACSITGSGPPSTSTTSPLLPKSKVASPWPTSRKTADSRGGGLAVRSGQLTAIATAATTSGRSRVERASSKPPISANDWRGSSWGHPWAVRASSSTNQAGSRPS